MTRLPPCLLALLLALGCGGSPPEPAPTPDRHAHGEHAGGDHGHHGHHGHEGHHGEGHDHSSPAALRPLMRDLYAWVAQVRGALDAGDAAAATEPSHAIAVACDDADVHEVDPERFGPDFASIDEELHASAGRLAHLAEEGRLEEARAELATMLDACARCHAQAPTAGHVDLGPLQP